MDNPAYLKAAGKEPHWELLPCEVCEEKQRQEEEKAKYRQERINELLRNSMLRKRFRDKSLDTFVPYGRHKKSQERILSVVRDFVDKFSRHRELGTWLLFQGNVGTGKTHLCAGIINEVIRQGYSALFTKTPRLLRDLKRICARGSERDEEGIFDRLQKVDLLVIDEIGVQFGTATERNIFFDVLDMRYEDMLPVIATTNVTDMQTLEQFIGPRVIDRFREGEFSGILTFDWESYRERSARHRTPGGKPPLRLAK